MTASAATVHHGCWAWWCANKTGAFGIGGLLVSKLERLAADLVYRQVWVATGGEAVEFYRQCGWRDAQELRLLGTRIQTTILNKRVGTTLT